MRPPPLDESLSNANAAKIKHGLFVMASTGESTKTIAELTDDILHSPNINPADKQALIKELPKLIEGQNLMRDDDVRQPITDRLNPRLAELSASMTGDMASMLHGRNLRAEVMKSYDMDIRRTFVAEYEDTGKWPSGHRKRELIDSAVDKAETLLEKITPISAMKDVQPRGSSRTPPQQTTTPTAASPAAPAQPSASTHTRVEVPGVPGVYQLVPK